MERGGGGGGGRRERRNSRSRDRSRDRGAGGGGRDHHHGDPRLDGMPDLVMHASNTCHKERGRVSSSRDERRVEGGGAWILLRQELA